MRTKREPPDPALLDQVLAELDEYAAGADPRNDPLLAQFLQCDRLQQASEDLASALDGHGRRFGDVFTAATDDPIPLAPMSILPF